MGEKDQVDQKGEENPQGRIAYRSGTDPSVNADLDKNQANDRARNHPIRMESNHAGK
jgi:hypothetical protein